MEKSESIKCPVCGSENLELLEKNERRFSFLCNNCLENEASPRTTLFHIPLEPQKIQADQKYNQTTDFLVDDK